jgi:hypothetical protein
LWVTQLDFWTLISSSINTDFWQPLLGRCTMPARPTPHLKQYQEYHSFHWATHEKIKKSKKIYKIEENQKKIKKII